MGRWWSKKLTCCYLEVREWRLEEHVWWWRRSTNISHHRHTEYILSIHFNFYIQSCFFLIQISFIELNFILFYESWLISIVFFIHCPPILVVSFGIVTWLWCPPVEHSVIIPIPKCRTIDLFCAYLVERNAFIFIGRSLVFDKLVLFPKDLIFVTWWFLLKILYLSLTHCYLFIWKIRYTKKLSYQQEVLLRR